MRTPSRTRHRLVSLAVRFVTCVSLFRPSLARAEPWFGWGQNHTEDRYESGDLDVEDLLDGTIVGRSHNGAESVRTGTWVTLGAFWRQLEAQRSDVGLLMIFSVAFDKVAQGNVHELGAVSIADGAAKFRPPPATAEPPPPALPPPSATATPSSPPAEPIQVLVTPSVARRAVAAAWRTSGLGVDDARIDSMVSRARASAALPEARFRAMRVVLDGSHAGVIPDDTSTYDTAGADMWLEGRLTWRLDRLLYADDEPTLERVRLERQDARTRVAGKVLDALFQWQRAWVSVHVVTPGTRESTDATMRLIEAEAGLEVMTGGWFGAWVARLTGPTQSQTQNQTGDQTAEERASR
jgi:hypothetical protein